MPLGGLAGLLDGVGRGERVPITRGGVVVAVLVSPDDGQILEELDELEDEADIAALVAARDEPEVETLDDVLERYGLTMGDQGRAAGSFDDRHDLPGG